MKLNDINKLEGGKTYLTELKKYIKNQDRILYMGEYIPQDSLDNIDTDISKHLMENFTIPMVYNNSDKYHGNIIEISKDCYDNLYHTLSEETIKNNAHNCLVVDINSSIKKINHFLYNNLYDNFILLCNNDSKQKIYHLVKEFHNQIENILLKDISKDIEKYKEDNNINNFFNKNKTKLENPIIQESLDNISANIHSFVSQLDKKIQETLLAHPNRKGRNKIIKQSEKYLTQRYHHKELKHLSYKESFEILTTSINQIYYSFGDEIHRLKEGEEPTKEYFYIEKLRKDLIDYLDNIKSLPSEEEIDEILEEIDEIIFDPFIRGYYDLDEDDDTGSQSRSLAEDFANIKNDIEELINLIEYKNYQDKNLKNYQNMDFKKGSEKSTTTIISVHDLFNKICTYRIEKDKENARNYIIKLQKNTDQEIKKLLSINNLKELLEIIARTNEEYVFAARIAKILEIDTK